MSTNLFEMGQILLDQISGPLLHNPIGMSTLLAVLVMVAVLSVYEMVVYRLVSHRAVYHRAFHISITVLPFFIATIILCLQSNLVITLGTIGALAIIRFRTAVKDPIDMIYILWSVHTGIVCGCQLYAVAVLTSVCVTVVLLILERVHLGKQPFVLVVHSSKGIEPQLTHDVLDVYSKKRYRIKSRNYTQDGVDLAIELSVKEPARLAEALSALAYVERFSIIEYDAGDIV